MAYDTLQINHLEYPKQTDTSKIRNVSHKNNWNQVTVQVHVETDLDYLNKSRNDEKSDKDCVQINCLEILR